MPFYKASVSDTGYPALLSASPSPPPFLWIDGTLMPKDSFAVAIVGTRTPSPYGREVAKRFAAFLVKHKVTLVSGLARGIDTIVHESALASGGRTIAVLGCGMNTIYPPENKGLAKQIVRQGALVSQFEPEAPLSPEKFLIRNRVIAGLSLCCLVIEGRRRSGTLSTATHTANIGREVFAIPGNITSPLSEAPHYLIQQGAQIAHKPEDILEYLTSMT